MQRRLLAGIALVVALAGAALAHGAPRDPLLRTITLTQVPAALSIDARTARAFVATGDSGDLTSHVLVLDLGNGTVLRRVRLPVPAPAFLAVDERVNRVVVAYQLDLSLLDAHDGTMLRTVGATPPGQVGSPVGTMVLDPAPPGRVYLAKANETIAVLDSSTGAMRGAFALKGVPSALALDKRAGRLVVATIAAAIDPGLIRGRVSLLDARSGRVLHTTTVGRLPDAVVVVARTRRAFVTNLLDNTVSVLDTVSGRVLRTVALGGMPRAVAADDRTGRIFVATDAGDVAVLDARSGTLLRRVDVGPYPAALLVDRERGRVYVVVRNADWNGGVPRGPGRIMVLDARRGTPLHTIAAGIAPVAAALDARSGRLVVANAGGVLLASDPWGWLPQWARDRLPFVPRGQPRTRTIPPSVSVFDIRS